MAHSQDIQLQIRGIPGSESSRGEGPEPAMLRTKRRSVRWRVLVLADMLMLLLGEAMAPLLCRLYYNSGGNSLWMATLVQSAGAPVLVIPLLLTPRAAAGDPRPAVSNLAAICVGLGLVIGCDNLMYSYAMLYLPVSTFSLVAATQLAFNAVTSRLINAQRFTALILNSVVVLTFSAALLGVGFSDDDETSSSNDVPRGKHALGFVLTLSASAVYALILSLFEVTFEKVIRTKTLRWVLKMQICTNVVASVVSVVALFASGEWRTIPGEMAAFKNGRAGYVGTLVGIAVGWQAATLGAVRLITRVSSLFANVTGTLALPLVPVFAVALFGDRMTGIKVVAVLMAVWGFLSYVYQHYLDDRRVATRKRRTAADCSVCAARIGASQAVVPAPDSDVA
ncbi:probable purine permease 11 [Phragmites australis]|uniref:probable purine permease 11 n=1 Tax=Phragmites australis TaxID=29695 RepID=UPI002D7719FF|nr:probable purine permease 11 [Phragmites australis]